MAVKLQYIVCLNKELELYVTPREGMLRIPVSVDSLPKGYRGMVGKNLLKINHSGVQFLSECDGTKTIEEIIKEKYPSLTYKQKEQVLSFVEEALKRKHIYLLPKKVHTEIKVIGSFDFFVPFHISVELTSQCNLRCIYCYNEFNNRLPQLTLYELLNVLEEWKKLGLRGIELTGGEPLMRPEFKDIFEWCVKNLENVAVLTNGTLLTPEIVDLMKSNEKKLLLSIGIDGSTSEIHERFSGVEGSYQLAIRGMKLLSQANLAYRASMTVTPYNYRDIENTLLLCKELGATSFAWAPALPFGRGKGLQEQGEWDTSPQQAEEFFELEQRLREKYKGFVTTFSDEIKGLLKQGENCGLGYKNVILGPGGLIKVCPMLPESYYPLGNVKDKSLEEIFSNPLLDYFWSIKAPTIEICEGCDYLAYCLYCVSRPIAILEKEKKLCRWAYENNLQKGCLI